MLIMIQSVLDCIVDQFYDPVHILSKHKLIHLIVDMLKCNEEEYRKVYYFRLHTAKKDNMNGRLF